MARVVEFAIECGHGVLCGSGLEEGGGEGAGFSNKAGERRVIVEKHIVLDFGDRCVAADDVREPCGFEGGKLRPVEDPRIPEPVAIAETLELIDQNPLECRAHA